ncbi:MAG: hypothetical protein ACRD2T_09505 [Thermoanaerobaculia bacterium]
MMAVLARRGKLAATAAALGALLVMAVGAPSAIEVFSEYLLLRRLASDHNTPEGMNAVKELRQRGLRWFRPRFEGALAGGGASMEDAAEASLVLYDVRDLLDRRVSFRLGPASMPVRVDDVLLLGGFLGREGVRLHHGPEGTRLMIEARPAAHRGVQGFLAALREALSPPLPPPGTR